MASTVWKGHLTFGLVSFPVKLYTAARAESISFNQLHKTDNSRIKQVIFCQAEDHASFQLAEPIPGPSTEAFQRFAKKHNVVVIASLFEKRAPGLYHNTAIVIDADPAEFGKQCERIAREQMDRYRTAFDQAGSA